ncbi:hypothetical protein HDU87_005237 [Geranomyces variabilis]|uniref:Uncharacterized protein n=1 Tax=Geranomyces variabilis TaxID=109894 RepID=A0AAD5XPH1_9FUNG|nr:hypothetical protein HDU87_005237 [Geranomyces variabilis]
MASLPQASSPLAIPPRSTVSVGTSTHSVSSSPPPPPPIPPLSSRAKTASSTAAAASRPPRGSLRGYIRFALGTTALIAGHETKALSHFMAAGMDGVAMGSTVAAFCSEFRIGMDADGEWGPDNLESETNRGQVSKANYETAERLYTLSALQGCGMAMARLAFLKTHGRVGIKIHQAEADKWRRGCAARGEDAVRWLRTTAAAGVAASQFCLALCHYNGIAVPENDAEAFRWCERAAKQGLAGAMNVLGNLHIEGAGCTQDPAAGLRWYIRAAELREAAAIYNIGTLFERGIAMEEDMSAAFGWYERASRYGSINAMNTLGIFYEQGLGTTHSMPFHAVRQYLEAARHGHPHAQYNLGRCYHEGFGLIRDDEKAALWFAQAAAQNHAVSQLSFAACQEFGLGVRADSRAALRHYEAAFANGASEAEKRLFPRSALALLPAARTLLLPHRKRPSSALLHTLPRELLDYILECAQITPLPAAHFRAVLAIASEPSTLSPHHPRLATAESFLEALGLAHLQIGALPLPACDCTRFGDDNDQDDDNDNDNDQENGDTNAHAECRSIKHVVDGVERAAPFPPIECDWAAHVAVLAPAAEEALESPTGWMPSYRADEEPVWWKDPAMLQVLEKR